MAAKVFGDRWEIVEPLGEGGQAWTYVVRDLDAKYEGRMVLKRLKNVTRLGRFEREIKAGNELGITGIEPVVDYSLADPAYFVTRFVDGPSLEELAPTTALAAIDIFLDLCEVLAEAHERGAVHRDLKPEHVIRSSKDGVTVIDFGLCVFVEDDGRLTETREQVGSRYYLAPELEGGRGAELGPAVDVYALGKILYYLLTGAHVVREGFSGPNDLVTVTGDRQLAYVTERVLKRAIVPDPRMRATVKMLLGEALEVRRLIKEHFYPGIEGAQCRFCGEGWYRRLPTATWTINRANRTGPMDFASVVCDRCGNIQWFST